MKKNQTQQATAWKRSPETNHLIHFKDHGQDLVRIEINQEGNIVSSGVFQGDRWLSWMIDMEEIKVGDLVKIVKVATGERITIKYPVDKIEEVPA